MLNKPINSIETFRKIGGYSLTSLMDNKPSCFNGEVCVKRYKVTIEEIKEPDNIIHARLQKLWEESDNFHHYQPLQSAAKEHGCKLVGNLGDKKKPRT